MKKTEKLDYLPAVGLAAFIIVAVIFLIILKNIGLFKLTATDSGAKVLAPMLALVGVLGTAMVTFVGLLFKRSFDLHKLRLQKEAEKRLSMDVAINAVKLMNTDTGAPAPESQQAGALFALASQGQIEFALALLEKMWPEGHINSSSAVWLIDYALRFGSEKLQDLAATVMRNNVAGLIESDGSSHNPMSLWYDWNTNLPVRARENIIDTFLELLLLKPVLGWNKGTLNGYFLRFYNIWESDPELRFRIEASLVLGNFLQSAYSTDPPERKKSGIFLDTGKSLIFDDVRLKMDGFFEEHGGDLVVSNQALGLIKKLRAWVAEADAEPAAEDDSSPRSHPS